MLGNTSLTHILLGNYGTNLKDPSNGIWGVLKALVVFSTPEICGASGYRGA